MSQNKKILIFGTGAVGGYYGGMLAKAGHDVTFIARGENYKVLKEKGLTLILGEEESRFPIKVYDSSKGLGVFDYIFICTKSYHTEETCKLIKENVGENTAIGSFQNGVENEDIILRYFGSRNAIGALVFVASKLKEPGVIYQFGYNGGFVGELGKSKSERVQYISDVFQKCGVDVKVSEDILADLWNKLVWNTSFNSISVVTGKTVDEILSDSDTLELLKNIMEEVKAVAVAHDIAIREDTVQYNIDRSYYYKGFKTSMLQDFEKGREIELEGLVGVVIRKSKEKNIPVPNTEKVYNAIKAKIKTVV
jgi:2-dehydropantoate 2-reductase